MMITPPGKAVGVAVGVVVGVAVGESAGVAVGVGVVATRSTLMASAITRLSSGVTAVSLKRTTKVPLKI